MECYKYNEALVTDRDLQEKVLAGGQNHFRMVFKNKNSAEGVIAPAGAKVTGATIRMWLLNKFISFLAVLTWKTGLKKV